MTLENPARRRPVETDLLRKSLRDSRRTWKTLRVSHSSHRPHDDDQVLIHHSGGRYYCLLRSETSVKAALASSWALSAGYEVIRGTSPVRGIRKADLSNTLSLI